MIQTKAGKAGWSLLMAVMLTFQAVPPVVIAEAAIPLRITAETYGDTGYFGDGSDGDLFVAAGQTVTLPVDVPHQSLVVRNYKNITIEAGGVLTTSAPNAGLVLKATGDVTIKGTIDQLGKAPKTNPSNSYPYPAELQCGAGGDGGKWGYNESFRLGGKGMPARKYGGGYSGGGAGSVGAAGGDADKITVAQEPIFIGGRGGIQSTEPTAGQYGGGGGGRSYNDRDEGWCTGGDGGSGPGGMNPNYDHTADGGGAAGNYGGGVVIIYCKGTLSISGKISCNGNNGGNAMDSGSGSPGGGGGGGSIYLSYGKSYDNTVGRLDVFGGTSGANKNKYGFVGMDGENGTVTATKAPDTVPPVISGVTVPTAWSTSNAVTVSATDNMSGIKEYAYSTASTAPSTGWQSGNSFTLTANGNYYAFAKDGMGNMTAGYAFTVSKVDTAVPTITTAAVTPVGWTNSGTKTITVTATDSQSGIAGYAITTNATAPASGWQTANTFTKAEGTYYAWAKDNAGRMSAYKQVAVSQIDITKPTISAVTVPTAWGQDNTITVTAADVGSGIKEYAVTNSGTAPSTGWQSGSSFTLSANGTYYAWARDNVGNVSLSRSFIVNKVDTAAPTITNAAVTPAGWTNSGTKTITVIATDSQSGIAGYVITTNATAPASGWQTANTFTKAAGIYYAWAKDNAGRVSAYKQVTVSQIDTAKPTISAVTVPTEWGQDNTVTVTAADVGSGIQEYAVTDHNSKPSTGWQNSNSFTLSANGTYYAWAKDKVGNISDGYSFVVDMVDADIPVISAADVTPKGWTESGTKTITVTAADSQSGISGYAITKNTTAPASGWQTANTFTKPEGTYYVWAKDNVDRVSAYKQVTVSQIDTAKPTISAVTVPTEWGQDNTVTVTAVDVGSGIQEYAVTDHNSKPSTGWQSGDIFTLSANGTYYAWAKDKVGNISDGYSFVVDMVDTDIPVISATAVTPEGWTGSGTKTITVTAADSQSGISGYAITENTTAPASGWQTANTFTKPEGTYYAWAKDSAGRVSAYKQVTVSQIDTAKPTISAVTVPTEWGQNNTVTVTAADIGSGIQEYAVTVSSSKPSTGWQSGDSFTLSVNSTYYAWAKDKVGNISDGYSFVVDMVDTDIPVISAADVTPEGWTGSGTKTITVTAADSQSGISGYAITENTTAPASDWQTANTFTKPEGTYYAWAKDSAGRVSAYKQVTVSQIDTAKPTISAVTVPTEWGQDNTVTVTAVDVGSGIKEYAVTNSGTAPSTGWQSSSSFTLSANGTYHAWARDNVGNVSLSRSFTVNKVDTAVPTITTTAVTPAGWTESGTKTITITAADSQSGIAGYAITENTAEPTSGWQSANTFTKSEGTYYVWAKDNVGRVSAYKQVTVSQIDTAKPTISAVTVPTVWGQNNTVTVTAADIGSGIQEYAVTVSSSKPSTGWQSGDSFTLSVNGTYYAWAKDKAGNISDGYSFVVDMVDTDIPVISATAVTPEGWTGSGTKTITVTAADSQSDVLEYAITGDMTIPVDDWQTANTFDKGAGAYYLWAKDIAGNISLPFSVAVGKVDNIKPIVSGVTVPDLWGTSASIGIGASDLGSGLQAYAVTKGGKPVDNWQSSAVITVTSNGDYSAWVKDNADNVSLSVPFTVSKIDKLKPVIESVTVREKRTLVQQRVGGKVPGVTSIEDLPDKWVKTVELVLSSTDSAATDGDGCSGVAGYAVGISKAEPAEGWQTSNSFTCEQNGIYYLWSKDGAGNVSEPKQYHLNKIDDIPPEFGNDSGEGDDESGGNGSVATPNRWVPVATVEVKGADNTGAQDFAVTETMEHPTVWQDDHYFDIEANGTYYAWIRDKSDNITGPDMFVVDKVDNLPPGVSGITFEGGMVKMDAQDAPASTESGSSGIIGYAISKAATAPPEARSVMPEVTDFDWHPDNDIILKEGGFYEARTIDRAGNISPPCLFEYVPLDTSTGGEDDAWDKVVDDILSDDSSEERVYSLTMNGNVRIPRSLLMRLRGKAVILRIEHGERYIWAIDCRTIGDIPPWRIYYDLTIKEGGEDSRYLYQLPHSMPIIKKIDVVHRDKEDLPFKAELSIRLHYSFAERYVVYLFKNAELIGGELSADRLPPYLKRKSE